MRVGERSEEGRQGRNYSTSLRMRTHLRGPSCIVLPFLIPFSLSFDGSGIARGETTQGPTGHALSYDFDRHHCDCSNCVLREDTSFVAA
jgi:hypothetical protein